MANFFLHIFADAKVISAILSRNEALVPLTDVKTWEFARATTCAIVGVNF